jgi:hypothetical protein
MRQHRRIAAIRDEQSVIHISVTNAKCLTTPPDRCSNEHENLCYDNLGRHFRLGKPDSLITAIDIYVWKKTALACSHDALSEHVAGLCADFIFCILHTGRKGGPSDTLLQSG